jgi:chromosome partitioning protein
MGKTISFVNFRVGSGRTSFAIKMAELLSEVGKTTMLVDFDPKGDMAQYLEIDKSFSILNILDKSREFPEVVHRSGIENSFLLPANIELSRIERGNIVESQKHLFDVLKYLKNKFDYVIIDTPPHETLLLQVAREFSDKVVVPLKMEDLAIHFLEKSLLEIERDKVLVVPNFYSDMKSGILYEVINRYITLLLESQDGNFVKIGENFQGDWEVLKEALI